MSVCTGCSFDYLWKDEVTTCPKECEGCVVIDGKPSKFKPMQKTNADRIRAMTDEELAKFIANKIVNIENHKMIEQGYTPTATQLSALGHTCYCVLVRWLKQPAEGETT